jgi:hypothetical protein
LVSSKYRYRGAKVVLGDYTVQRCESSTAMPELLLNLHMHTPYSDGSGSHAVIAAAALRAGLDAVIVTDHNVYVEGIEGYRLDGQRRLLLIMGEEVHDRTRVPQKNHLLIIGAGREMSPFGTNPQGLIDQVQRAGGLSFIAHPVDPALPAFGEDNISWESWEVRGFTGLELWNGFSELKRSIHSRLDGLFYAFFPQFYPHGPDPEALRRWDELMNNRHERVVAVGGSDAHALSMHLGPLHRTIFPYDYHFRAVNTHLLTTEAFHGDDFLADREIIYTALRQGNAFIGYDLPAPTRGFRFTAQGQSGSASMGDEIRLGPGITFQIRLPGRAECRLLHNGKIIKRWTAGRAVYTHVANQTGIYRVECYIQYLGKSRAWIISNPIYVRG